MLYKPNSFVSLSGESSGNFEKFRETPEIPKFREIQKNVGKFAPGKFREIFPRIFRDFQGMKHMLQP